MIISYFIITKTFHFKSFIYDTLSIPSRLLQPDHPAERGGAAGSTKRTAGIPLRMPAGRVPATALANGGNGPSGRLYFIRQSDRAPPVAMVLPLGGKSAGSRLAAK